MSASQPGNMSGPRVTTPLLLLLLLLLLLTALTGTVLCQDKESETPEDDTGDSGDTETAEALQASIDPSLAPHASTTDPTVDENMEEDHGSGQHHDPRIHGFSETTESPIFMETTMEPEVEGLDLIIILIPAVLVVLIISIIVCGIFINRRWKQKSKNEDLGKEDPHLDDCSSEKVPMPMFEEDVPSVLEVEMEELDQWMKKDGESAEDTKDV